jgi:hypothetical protein
MAPRRRWLEQLYLWVDGIHVQARLEEAAQWFSG